MSDKTIRLIDIEKWLLDNLNNEKRGYCYNDRAAGRPHVNVWSVIQDLEKDFQNR